MRIRTMLLLALGLVLAPGCGSSSCKKACKHIAECLGITDAGTGDSGAVGWTCPLSSECTPLEKCQAKCITKAPCEAFTDLGSQAAQDLASCYAACQISAPDAAGEGIAVDLGLTPDASSDAPSDGPSVPLDSQPDEGPCVPSCAGKQCGPDGCGGSCGSCTSPATCDTSGQCVGGGSCGAVTFEGCCDGQTLKYCESSKLETVDCTADLSCGWDPASSYYSCGTDGSAEPSGQHPKSCPP